MGGKKMSSNYYLHVRFSKDFEEKITTLQSSLVQNTIVQNTFIPFIKKQSTMPAHITLSYGPKIEYDDMTDSSLYEIKDMSDFNKIYPGLLDKINTSKIPHIKYKAIKPFLLPENIVICLEIESDILLDLVKYCRKNVSSYNEVVKEWKRNYDLMKESIKKRYPSIYKEEHSFDENPIGALHITVIVLEPDTPEDVVISIMRYVEASLSHMGINKGDRLIADRIDLKTPITKRFIDVYKYI